LTVSPAGCPTNTPSTVSSPGGIRGAANVREENKVTLTVTDDGRGFDSASMWGSGVCLGPGRMSKRVEAPGGHLTIESTPGQGTQVMVQCALSVQCPQVDPVVHKAKGV
jgi:signal transduction histidine kinase